LDHEEEVVNDLAERINRMQVTARAKALKRKPTAALERGFHAKGVGVRARFQIRADVPAYLQTGLFVPGAEYDALVRFSNAKGEIQCDFAKDQRGIAIRLKTVVDERLTPADQVAIQDFLLTNTPISFARSPEQFIEVGELLLGSTLLVAPRLWRLYGFQEARRILGIFLGVPGAKPWQANRYWSRTAFQFGDYTAKFLVRPSSKAQTLSSLEQLRGRWRCLTTGEGDFLKAKLEAALKAGDIVFDFLIQLFVDENKTPIEDASHEWKESDSPPIALAKLIIPQQNLDDQLERDIEHMAFNPWHTSDHLPLGRINRARKKVYEASASKRNG
jgi:catalase